MIGFIFDCDGTLIDSEPAHFKSWQESLSKRGIYLTEEEYYFLSGRPGCYISEKFYKQSPQEGDSPEAIYEDKKKSYHILHEKGLNPIPSMVKLVQELVEEKRKRRIKLAVASAAPKEEIHKNLKQIGIGDIFDVIVSGIEDISHYEDPEGVNKPKPYIYQHAAKLLGIPPSSCVAFEDSNPGVLSAKRAGMITFAVPNGFTSKQDFSEAHFILDPSKEISAESILHKVSKLLGSIL